MEKPLKERTAKGLFWGGFNSLFQQVIQLVFGIFMARILFPEDFGLVGMLGIFTIFATTLQESGFSIALINRKNIDQDAYSSVFWINTGISLLLYILLFFLSPVIASFFNQPLLTNLARVVFLSFVFNALGIIQNTILTKRLEMRKITIVTLISLLASCSVGLVLALLGFSYWSIAIQMVALSFFRTVILWLMSDWRPSFLFNKKLVREMFSFSSKLLLSTLLFHAATGMYSFLLGKFYDKDQVGFYSQANKWYSIPMGLVLGVINSVVLPVFAEVNDDRERQILVFRKMMRFTSFIAFPIILGFSFIAEELIPILVTIKWAESIPILQLLCITAVFYPITVLYSNLLYSQGYSGIVLVINSIYSVLLILLLLSTISLGIIKMIIFNGFLYLFYILCFILAVKKHIGLKYNYFIKDVFPFLLITLFAFGVAGILVSPLSNLYVILFAKIVISVLIYIVIMKFSKIAIFRESMGFIKQKLLNR